ncbi:aromatic ring-hydroxylating dioxygenase subunit alpha [Sphingobium sp. EM0848]|uniref:aromatic ring-hydroxylating oxygenase subunit alpha n=1 Tax=Sphingobium sp. EM0848 TaxID=2743473 RepID=UPI00159C98F4|nr:aromatic ring-hydroxylating dioxygenase subunit alpha [Sphingobium sp. EM0848]
MTNIKSDVFDLMVDHIRNGTTDLADADLRIPSRHFSSEEHAAAERDLLRRLPLIAAHHAELPDPGSFITRDVMGVALLIVRQPDGTVAAFRNMCRHRGGKVEMAPSGNKPFFVCGYHGWSYNRAGALRGIPFEDSFDPIDRGCHSLIPVGCAERHGLIWVDLSVREPALNLSAFMSEEADREFATFQIDKTVIAIEHDYTLDVNWKLVMDGAYDVLHPQFLHPTGVGKLVHSNVGIWKDYGRHGQLFTARRRLAEVVKKGENPEAAWRYFATVFVLYPNSLCIAAPDHYEFWTVWPDEQSASRCHVRIRFLIDPAKLTDEMQARLERSLAILEEAAMNEDWPMEETIQANARTSPDVEFIYGRSEISCQHLHRQLGRDLAAASQ